MTLLSSPSSIAPLVRGLDPAHFGVVLDPGNQRIEGHEDPRKAVQLLGPHLAAVGIKGVLIKRNQARAGDADKGWSFHMMPCEEGLTDWSAVGDALRSVGFLGTAVMMPFYHADSDQERNRILRRKVNYIKRHLDQRDEFAQ